MGAMQIIQSIALVWSGAIVNLCVAYLVAAMRQ